MTRLRRVSPSQTTKDSIIVPHNTKGQPVDPNTWEPLVKGQIDIGHNYQFEERVMRKAAERVNMSQADYSKMMNDPKLYRLETRHNNRSHKFECPNYSEQVHAAFKTIRQFYNKQRSAQREAVVEARLKAKYGNKPHYKSTVQHTDGKHAIIGYSTGHPVHRSAQGSRSLSDIAASHKSAAAAHSKSSGSSLSLGSIAASHQAGCSGHAVGGSKSGGHSSGVGHGGKSGGHSSGVGHGGKSGGHGR